VASYEDLNTRVPFQLIIDEGGGYKFACADIDGTFLELGGGATIGIENEEGPGSVSRGFRQPLDVVPGASLAHLC
jgi:hypothetical protein